MPVDPPVRVRLQAFPAPRRARVQNAPCGFLVTRRFAMFGSLSDNLCRRVNLKLQACIAYQSQVLVVCSYWKNCPAAILWAGGLFIVAARWFKVNRGWNQSRLLLLLQRQPSSQQGRRSISRCIRSLGCSLQWSLPARL